MKFETINRRFITIEPINENILLLGSDNSYVDIYDLRTKHKLKNLYKHVEDNEVCKVRYSKSNQMVISGGNDNNIILFDLRKDKICKVFKHKAAVKGLAINPNGDILVSGGGTFDKIIKLWNLKKLNQTGELLTDSQITNIECLTDDSFFISHGYISNNVVLYKFDENFVIDKAALMEKHNKRILYMSKSSDDILGSCSTDGVLKLWKTGKFIAKGILQEDSAYCAIR
jgi:cell division cycle 20-like protein 1 (cofactor of APC complex)